MVVKELILLAMGPSRISCPYDCETWGLNTGYRQVKSANGHIEKLFLAHTQVKREDGGDVFDWQEINNLNIDVINTHRVKELKSRLYPMKRISEKFGCDYYSDTICYMLVYAIDQNTTLRNGVVRLKQPLRIRIYGADMQTPDEYDTEKGGIEYWVGYAKGLGIKVEIAKGSLLLKTTTGKPYGIKCQPSDTLITKCKYVNDFLTPSSNVKVGVIDGSVIDLIMEGWDVKGRAGKDSVSERSSGVSGSPV